MIHTLNACIWWGVALRRKSGRSSINLTAECLRLPTLTYFGILLSEFRLVRTVRLTVLFTLLKTLYLQSSCEDFVYATIDPTPLNIADSFLTRVQRWRLIWSRQGDGNLIWQHHNCDAFSSWRTGKPHPNLGCTWVKSDTHKICLFKVFSFSIFVSREKSIFLFLNYF